MRGDDQQGMSHCPLKVPVRRVDKGPVKSPTSWALGIAEDRWLGYREERSAGDLVLLRPGENTPAPRAGPGSPFDNNQGTA